MMTCAAPPNEPAIRSVASADPEGARTSTGSAMPLNVPVDSEDVARRELVRTLVQSL